MDSIRLEPAIQQVIEEVLVRSKNDPARFFSDLVRRAVDEVIDGPRTGRWSITQLEKTEATYVGTKVEIMVRADLNLEKGRRLDLLVAGHDVDVKWSKTSNYMIPTEAVGEICLCIGGRRRLSSISVGVLRCTPDRLSAGKNKDGKVGINSTGRAAMTMLVVDAPLPRNFVADMDPAVRHAVMTRGSIQGRIDALAEACPYTPVHRDAICTIARTSGDPARRLRQDVHRRDTPNAMRWLGQKYRREIVSALGLAPLGKDEWIAVPQRDIDAAGLHL